MSLEAALADNTAAINKLIQLLSAQAEVATSNTASDQPATGVPHAPSPQVEVAVSEPEEPSSPPVSADVTYQDALKAITSLANEKGRQAAVDVLSQFGLKRLTEARPEQFMAIIEAARAA